MWKSFRILKKFIIDIVPILKKIDLSSYYNGIKFKNYNILTFISKISTNSKYMISEYESIINKQDNDVMIDVSQKTQYTPFEIVLFSDMNIVKNAIYTLNSTRNNVTKNNNINIDFYPSIDNVNIKLKPSTYIVDFLGLHSYHDKEHNLTHKIYIDNVLYKTVNINSKELGKRYYLKKDKEFTIRLDLQTISGYTHSDYVKLIALYNSNEYDYVSNIYNSYGTYTFINGLKTKYCFISLVRSSWDMSVTLVVKYGDKEIRKSGHSYTSSLTICESETNELLYVTVIYSGRDEFENNRISINCSYELENIEDNKNDFKTGILVFENK